MANSKSRSAFQTYSGARIQSRNVSLGILILLGELDERLRIRCARDVIIVVIRSSRNDNVRFLLRKDADLSQERSSRSCQLRPSESPFGALYVTRHRSYSVFDRGVSMMRRMRYKFVITLIKAILLFRVYAIAGVSRVLRDVPVFCVSFMTVGFIAVSLSRVCARDEQKLQM